MSGNPRAVKFARGHSFKTDLPIARFIGRPVCSLCGLVRLKNTLTEWCIAKGCDYEDAPGYREALRTLPAVHRQGVRS